jgi:hypothetical protein
MKKLIVFTMIMLLAASLCFAETNNSEPLGIEGFDLEIYAGFPIHWTNAEHDQDFYWFNPGYNMEDKSVTANTAIGLSMLFNFTKKTGFSLEADFFYGTKLAGFANPSSDYLSMFGANVFMGPVFYLYNGIFLRIPLTIGGHLYYFSDDLWMPNLVGFDPATPPVTPVPDTRGYWINRSDLQIGPGISLGVQFHFSKSIYIFSRTNVAIDVFRMHEMKYIADDGTGTGTFEAKSKSDTEFTVSWEVKPVLGIGIKF